MGDIWISARKEGLATNDGKFTWCILWRNRRNYSTLESVPKGTFFYRKIDEITIDNVDFIQL